MTKRICPDCGVEHQSKDETSTLCTDQYGCQKDVIGLNLTFAAVVLRATDK